MPSLVTSSIHVGSIGGTNDAEVLKLVHLRPVANGLQLSPGGVDRGHSPLSTNGVVAIVQVDRHGIALGEDVTVGFGLHGELLARSHCTFGEEVGGVFGGSTAAFGLDVIRNNDAKTHEGRNCNGAKGVC